MTSKYSIRPVTPEEIQALFWDERKKDFIFPSQEDMQRYIEKYESKKPMEGIEIFKSQDLNEPENS